MLTAVVALLSAVAADPPLTPAQRDKLKESQYLANAVVLLEAAGKLADAAEAARKVAAIEREVLGPDHPTAAESLDRVGRIQMKRDDWAAARAAYRESTRVWAAARGPDHWRAADARLALADVDRFAAMTPADLAAARRADDLHRDGIKARDDGRYPDAERLLTEARTLATKVFGPDHYRTADFFNSVGVLYWAQGRYADAETEFRAALAVRRKILPPGHPDTAQTLENVGVQLQSRGRPADAEPLLREALAAWKAAVGPDDARVANCLGWIAATLSARGRFADAEPLLKEALSIKRKALGPGDPDVADGIADLAGTYQHLGRFADAEPLLKEALAIDKRALGPDHPRTASIGNNLGTLYWEQGRFRDAEGVFKEVLAARRKALGPDHPDTGQTAENLGVQYQSMGRPADAEPLFREALAVWKKALGPDHASTANCLSWLATACQSQGRYAAAEPLLKEALAAKRRSLGPDHPDTADGLTNLAGLYKIEGRYADAEPLLRQAAAIDRKALGEYHPRTMTILNSLGTFYWFVGRYADAEQVFRDVLAGREKALGPDHPDTVQTAENLGVQNWAQGRHADAERLFQSALAGWTKAVGPDHPGPLGCESWLARAYQSQGKFAAAEPLYKRVLDVRRKSLGPGHPDTAMSLGNLASLYREMGRTGEAEPLAREAVAAAADHLDATAAVQSEASQLASVAARRYALDTYLGCSAKAEAGSAYDLVLRWQGAVTSRQTFARAARSADPATAGLLAELTDVSRKYATLANAPGKKTDVSAKLKDLAERRDELEGQLAAGSAGFDRYVSNRGLTTADLQKALPPDVALVHYVGYDKKLAAFVVRRGAVARVEFGDAAPVAVAVDGFRGTLSRGRPTTGRPDDPAVALRKLLWEPVAAHVGGATTVLVCPDGPLCRVPFAALPGSDPAKYLIEEVAVAVAPVPRLLPELLAGRGPTPAAPASLLAVGDVDFDADPAAALALAEPTGANWKRVRSGAAGRWDRLPGTRGEADELAGLFRAAAPGGRLTRLGGVEATEAAVRAAAGRSAYLHLATHGFFAPPTPAPAVPQGGTGTGMVLSVGPNPGVLCGLALAGANKPKGEDDGVLTALEVGDLDLSGVELAVLSACETGLGNVAGGEGVLGLQRAFQVAGARTTVTTLWQIPDAATQKLMARFYDNLWGKKLGKLAALREAQVWMLRDGAADPGVKRGLVRADDDPAPAGPADGRLPPFYWAAFTLAGDWR